MRDLTNATFDWATPTPRPPSYYDMISRKASAESNFLNLEGSWKVSNTLTLSGNAGTPHGKGKTLTPGRVRRHISRLQAVASSSRAADTAPAFNFGNANGAAPKPSGTDWIFGDQNVIVQDKDKLGAGGCGVHP